MWVIKSSGQTIGQKPTKNAAVSFAKQKAKASTDQIQLVVETKDSRISDRRTYEGPEDMSELDDISIF